MTDQNLNTTYSKSPSNSDQSNAAKKLNQNKKLFGIDKRALFTVIGLTSFIVLTMAGVYIATFQRVKEGPIAPTAPESKPQAAQKSSCSLSFVVDDESVQTPAISCIKESFEDQLSNSAGNYDFSSAQSNFSPGDNVVFKVTATNSGNVALHLGASDLFTIGGMDKLTFLDTTTECEFTEYDSLVCGAGGINIEPGASHVFSFRAKINENISADTIITNTASVSGSVVPENAQGTYATEPVVDNCQIAINVYPGEEPTPTPGVTPSPTPSVSPSPSPSPTTVVCYDQCNTITLICPTYHTCNNGRCAYNPCLESGVNCDAKLCTIIEPTPTPVAPAGCNDACSTNSDCANTSHICWYGRCRLDTNPNSETCTITTYTQTVVTQQQVVTTQPELPQQLPQTGILDDGLRILGAGAAAVIFGGLLLFLL